MCKFIPSSYHVDDEGVAILSEMIMLASRLSEGAS